MPKRISVPRTTGENMLAKSIVDAFIEESEEEEVSVKQAAAARWSKTSDEKAA